MTPEQMKAEMKRLEADNKRLNMVLCMAERSLDRAESALHEARQIVKFALGRG